MMMIPILGNIFGNTVLFFPPYESITNNTKHSKRRLITRCCHCRSRGMMRKNIFEENRKRLALFMRILYCSYPHKRRGVWLKCRN